MPNYQNGKIYRIVCNETGEQYIGSTTQTLAQRLTQHKYYKNCNSTQIIERGNYAIVLIEDCPCANKEQLERRERYFIENMECVNYIIPTRTKKEYHQTYRERRLEGFRKYAQENREIITERRRKYAEDNHEIIAERRRKYYQRKKLEKQT